MRPAVPAGLLILGFGGHARSLADVALACGVPALLFVDEAARESESFLGHAVRRELPAVLPAGWAGMPASGRAELRAAQIALLRERGWPVATVVAPSATLGAGCAVGAGTFVGHHAHVGPLAIVGEAVIINTAAVVEHDCVVGDCTHISVHTTVAGRSRVGAHCFIGTGATVIDGITIGDHVTVGAGGVAVQDIGEPGTYAGVPLRRLP